nr:unnamed protein product [Digitaria exilis]
MAASRRNRGARGRGSQAWCVPPLGRAAFGRHRRELAQGQCGIPPPSSAMTPASLGRSCLPCLQSRRICRASTRVLDPFRYGARAVGIAAGFARRDVG